MSTFTDYNGPSESAFTGNNGPSTPGCNKSGSVKTYIELIEAYEALANVVYSHIQSNVPETGANPHLTKDYVTAALEHKQDKLTFDILPRLASTNPVTSEGIASAINLVSSSKQDKLTFDDTPTEGSNNPVTSEGVLSAIDTAIDAIKAAYQQKLTFDATPTAGSTNPVTSEGIDAAIAEVRDSLTSFLSNFTVTPDVVTAKSVLAATEYLLGKVHASEILDFTDWVTFSAQHAGLNTSDTTATSGAYIIGQLSVDWGNEPGDQPIDVHKSKACRAYIKYVNVHPLDAIIDATVSYDSEKGYTGSIAAQIAHQPGDWEDLAFHLMEGTDTKGNKVIYICLSSSSLTYLYDEYDTFTFRACGINFIPPTADGYIYPVGGSDYIGMPIASVYCGATTSTYAINVATINELYITKLFTNNGASIFEIKNIAGRDRVVFKETPYVRGGSGNDWPVLSGAIIDDILPVGAGIRWSNMESIPSHFLAANGQTVSAEVYAQLANVFPPDAEGMITLPEEDHTIIRAE